ncbi:MAG TPA: hypothetical protein VGS58_04915, partial [Candidatus Sulfopaludibacter sp.]|nr:hypothetical protein [Candidatus Sulfopaludibacter sp.]
MPAVNTVVLGGAAAPVLSGVVNSATLAPPVAPGSLAAVLGSLTGAELSLNGAAVSPLSATGSRIDFYVPPDTPLGTASVTAASPAGAQATAPVNEAPLAPG